MPRPRSLLVLALAFPLSTFACKRDRYQYSAEPSSWESSLRSSTASASASPEQVCEHIADLITAEIGPVDPAVRTSTVDSCTTEMIDEQRVRGPTEWDLVARCVLDSYSKADINHCDQLYPGPGAQPPGQPSGTREEEACIHMLSMLLFETGSVDSLTDAELQQMQEECLEAFDQDRRAMTGSEYDQMISCILGAGSVAQMETCGSY